MVVVGERIDKPPTYQLQEDLLAKERFAKCAGVLELSLF
jgi:hypothetical protein